ncbi:MAG: (Fe-S)-binding protein [Anaerolineaceae bacterium]|nr:(Fe-S)-binding protein [Anaerolineaceae bacterium]
MELQKVERLARLCETCPKMCRHVCTTHVVTRSEADTPNERSSIAYRALLRGYFFPEEAPYMYEKCATCGLCLAWCETGIDVGEIMLAARVDLVNAGMAPAAAAAVQRNVQNQGNPHGEPASERYAAIMDEFQALPNTAEVLYYAGCDTLYRQPEIAKAALKVLRAAGVDHTMIKSGEPCCGEPLRLMGYIEDFKATARKVMDGIAETRARTVVCTCPSCLRMLKEVYREHGIEAPAGVEFLHMSEYLLRLTASGQLKLTTPVHLKTTYHDPCDLGRRQEIYEPPREVLTSLPGIQFQEMFFNRRDARCCGAGGGLAATNLELVIKASKTVVNLAQDVSAEVLVTACPTCKTSFHRQTYKLDDLKTMDLIELVAMAL